VLALKKRSLPWKFSLYWIYFLHSGFFTTCACLENRVCPKIFHCIEYTFYIQDFWATCACPEKQSVPWKFLLYCIYFLHSGFLSNLRLSWKKNYPGIFHCIEIYFIIQDFEQLAFALKTVFDLKFFKPRGAAAPPVPPPRASMLRTKYCFLPNASFCRMS